jgi:hypothetical protein
MFKARTGRACCLSVIRNCTYQYKLYYWRFFFMLKQKTVPDFSTFPIIFFHYENVDVTVEIHLGTQNPSRVDFILLFMKLFVEICVLKSV